MTVKAMRRALVIFLITLIIAIVAIFMTYRYFLSYPDRSASSSSADIKITIPRGAAFPKVVTILEDAKLISSPFAFRIYANYKGVASKVRAGNYTFKANISPRVLLNTLVHGVPAPTVSVTIPEGKNMLEVAAILAKAKIAAKEQLISKMRDVHFLRRLGIKGDSMEGFLFPDTYRFRTFSNAEDVLKALYKRHKSVYVRLRRKYQKGLLYLRTTLGWGHEEIVTMASIVEKETGQAHERPLIAQVFLNRLTFSSFQPKLLQTDPTIIYGCTVAEEKSEACQSFKGRIRRIHLKDEENPYNTYAHTGLPPGPISNPGAKAIEAVLHPKKSRYLFFVSKNDGTHQFSKTKTEHERAVDIYQRGIKPSK